MLADRTSRRRVMASAKALRAASLLAVLANARLELARTVAFAAGPALPGPPVGWTGSTLAFAAASAFSLGAVFLLAGLRESARESPARRDAVGEIREGARFGFAHELLRPIF